MAGNFFTDIPLIVLEFLQQTGKEQHPDEKLLAERILATWGNLLDQFNPDWRELSKEACVTRILAEEEIKSFVKETTTDEKGVQRLFETIHTLTAQGGAHTKEEIAKLLRESTAFYPNFDETTSFMKEMLKRTSDVIEDGGPIIEDRWLCSVATGLSTSPGVRVLS